MNNLLLFLHHLRFLLLFLLLLLLLFRLIQGKPCIDLVRVLVLNDPPARQFPSLVNCCTIDWFKEWPNDALVGLCRLNTVQVECRLNPGLHT